MHPSWGCLPWEKPHLNHHPAVGHHVTTSAGHQPHRTRRGQNTLSGGRTRAVLPHSPLSATEGPGQHPRVPGTALGSPVSPQPGVLGQRPGVLHLPTDQGSSWPGAGPEVTQRRPQPPGHCSVSPGARSAATGQRVAKWLPQTASASGETSERQLEGLRGGDAPGSASPWSGEACERKASATRGDGALWAAPLWSSSGGPLLYGGALEDAG